MNNINKFITEIILTQKSDHPVQCNVQAILGELYPHTNDQPTPENTEEVYKFLGMLAFTPTNQDLAHSAAKLCVGMVLDEILTSNLSAVAKLASIYLAIGVNDAIEDASFEEKFSVKCKPGQHRPTTQTIKTKYKKTVLLNQMATLVQTGEAETQEDAAVHLEQESIGTELEITSEGIKSERYRRQYAEQQARERHPQEPVYSYKERPEQNVPVCPECGEVENISKNGKVPSGHQRFRCKICGKNFLSGYTKIGSKAETATQIRRLAESGLSQGEIARQLSISPNTVSKHLRP